MSFVVSNLDHHFHEQRFSGIHVDGRLGGATQDTLRVFVTALDQATPHRFAVFAYPVTTVRYNATVSLLMDAVMPYGEILLYH
ncbi:hypothetical protein AAC387_Pa06g0590 [Persea americana]